MSNRLPQLGKPDHTASFKEMILNYLSRKGWNQEQLANAARINPSELSKIINGIRDNVRVDYLACICLALQTTVEESQDLAARVERVFSMTSATHRAYIELIKQYSEKPFVCEVEVTWLDGADNYLRTRGLPSLPNCDAY